MRILWFLEFSGIMVLFALKSGILYLIVDLPRRLFLIGKTKNKYSQNKFRQKKVSENLFFQAISYISILFSIN